MRRMLITVIAIGAIIAALRIVDLVVATSARRDSGVGSAEWIWAAGSELGRVGPQAFLAVRDFELDEIPETASLWIAADEEYVLSLNGKMLGIGLMKRPISLDGYRVEDLLEHGSNRISVELRSSRGAGGCLVSLESPETDSLVVSDRLWKIFRRYEVGIARGLSPLDRGEAPWSWGSPKVGRWALPGRGKESPRWDQFAGDTALHGRILGEPGMSRRQRLELAESPIVTFDFGLTLTGFLNIGLTGDQPLRALIYTGDERPPDPRGDQEPAGYVISVPGSPLWRDSVARRFRFVTLVGVNQTVRVRALESAVDARHTQDLPEIGVLGIEPPSLRSPMKYEVWRKLESSEGSP